MKSRKSIKKHENLLFLFKLSPNAQWLLTTRIEISFPQCKVLPLAFKNCVLFKSDDKKWPISLQKISLLLRKFINWEQAADLGLTFLFPYVVLFNFLVPKISIVALAKTLGEKFDMFWQCSRGTDVSGKSPAGCH